MIIPEPIEVLNKRLIDHYGLFEDGSPNWRIVWSDDQIEKRLTDCTRDGFQLPQPMIIEALKYSQWIQHKYILERLIPLDGEAQLVLGNKISYECLWVFEDKHSNPLPPKWEAMKIVIDQVYRNATPAGYAKYKQPENYDEERINQLEKDLFGDESSVADSLSRGDAIGYGVKQ